MPSRYRIMFGATLAMLALVCYAATRSDADGDRTAIHAVTVNASSEDTASIPDFDGDGTIGFGDFVIFAGVFGARQGDEKYDTTHDLNDDGEIGFSDFVIFARNFGKDAPSPVVVIPDPNLRAVIEDALDKESGAPITQAEMATLDSLTARGKVISDLTGLGSAANLTYLALSFNKITNVSELASLTNLTQLKLVENTITDISPLSGLTNLTLLWLNANDLTDVSALAGLTNLTWLDLAGNNITDISPLSGLTNLSILWLAGNNITDVSGLVGLTNLLELDLRATPLSDSSIDDHIPALKRNGIRVRFDWFRVEGDFDIELVFLVPVTETQKRLYRSVARRWMAVIVEDLPDYEFTQGWKGKCSDHSYEIPSGERIDDLRIYVTSFEGGSGGFVAWGGPSLLREETHLPVLGCMASRSLNYINNGLHEIGHVLGFGTVWDDLGLIQNFSRDDPNADTHFNGPLAIAAFDDAGGRDYSGAKVPVHKMDGAHWRWPVLNGELMGPGGGRALSGITVQSLADLGYGVDVTQADPYTLPGASAGKVVAKIAVAIPSPSGQDVDVTRAHSFFLHDPDFYGQGGISIGFPSIVGDDGQTGRLQSAERVWGQGVKFNLWENRQMWRVAPPAHAEPELTCGAALINEPIYVVDPQGRVVRTIRH